MAAIPQTMRSLVAPRKCKPSAYEVQTVSTPKITKSTQVLIKVHAASIYTGDTQVANNELSIFYTPSFPFPLSLEGSGTVVQVGSDVKDLRVGDEVYGAAVEKPMFREAPAGFASEYAVVKENLIIRKPPNISFEDAASLPGNVITMFQTFRRALQRMGCESLEGKTVFVTAGLSSTGSIAIQAAKRIFGATRVITTVSTPKVPLVEELLPGLVDQVIDYKTQKLTDQAPKGSVDLMINTQFSSLTPGIPLVNPDTGVIMLVVGVPTRATVIPMLGDRMPWWLGPVLDMAQLYYKWYLWGTNIQHEMLSGSPDVREDLELAGEAVALGKVKAVVKTVRLSDLEAIRRECEHVYTGKGGTGKLVITVDGA